MMNLGLTLIVMTTFFTVIAQLIIKWRIDNIDFRLDGNIVEQFVSLILLLFDKYIIAGLFLAVIASIFWMATLSKFNLSHAYPMIIALLIIFTTISSIIFLGESLSYLKSLGIIVVIIGLTILWFGK